MRRRRFRVEQITGIPRDQKASMAAAEVCRKHGVSQPTFYIRKAEFGGTSILDAKRLR